ncbi:N-acetylmuramoyl-L-alanine amidase family protein [Calidithermus timidus]|uniref:N-acetylmuramoyl-L-alanine amidase family protein n=1 Tax=Calidithermus timidus TaxID=307124 RepID=UPI0005938686|nr:N-acetylmuramoyl-L-alanine amidase [Calidithermus timidus]
MFRTALICFALLTPPTWAAELNPPRIGDQAGYTRVVLEIPPGAPFRLEPLGPALRVTLPHQSVKPEVRQVGTPELSGYILEQREDDALVTLLTPQGVGRSWGFRKIGLAPAAGTNRERLVLDISGAFVDPAPLPQLPPFSFVKASGRLFSVVLDAGHGGPDPGAIGLVIEKEVNLEVARRVGSLLEAAGVEVTYTRQDDSAFSSDKRTDLSRRVALAQGKDLFVSIHANAAPRGKEDAWCGLEVYYFGPSSKPVYPAALPLEVLPQPAPAQTPLTPVPPAPPPDPSFPEPAPAETTPLPVTPEVAMGVFEPTPGAPSDSPQDGPQARTQGEGPNPGSLEPLEPVPAPPPLLPQPASPLSLGQSRRVELSRSLGTKLLGYLLSSTTAANRGLRTSDFFVNKYAPVPSVLVEMGYVTHPIEGLNLRNPRYLDRIAYGIARGVLEYLEHDYPAH